MFKKILGAFWKISMPLILVLVMASLCFAMTIEYGWLAIFYIPLYIIAAVFMSFILFLASCYISYVVETKKLTGFFKRYGEANDCDVSLTEFDILKSHIGHKIVVVGYGQEEIVNASIECEDCNEVLYSVEKYEE